MNPVLVLSRPNSRDGQALLAWLWEWNIPRENQICNDPSAAPSQLITVVDGRSFSGSLAQQREYLAKLFGLQKPVLHD